MKKIIFFIVLICLIFGTNNYQELNNIAIITNIGISNTDNYKVIFQEVIPIKADNKIEKKYKYYKANGNTLNDALKKIDEIISKNVYLDHLENIIIQDNSKKIISSFDNYFKEDLDNFNIVLTPNNIDYIIKYNNNSNYINSLIKNKTTYRDIKKSLIEKKNIKIPVVRLNNKNLFFINMRI